MVQRSEGSQGHEHDPQDIGVRLVLRDDGVEVAAEPNAPEIAMQRPGRRPQALPDSGSVLVRSGARLTFGQFILELRDAPALPAQRRPPRSSQSLLGVDEQLALIRSDALAAQAALRAVVGGQAHVDVLEEAMATSREVLSDGPGVLPPRYLPRLAPVNLVENIGEALAGDGRTVRIPREATATAAVMVGLGDRILVSVWSDSGPVSIVLAHDGFSDVADVRCRRAGLVCPAVEWRYEDSLRTRGVDLSVPRMLGIAPDADGDVVAIAWHGRLLDMLQPHDW